MRFLIIFSALLSTSLFASEHSEASIKELAWPAFNFSVLFALIFWKARKPLAKLFTEKSKKVQAIYREAEDKYKEAQESFDKNQNRLQNIDTQSGQIMKDAQIEAEHMEARFHEELKERTERMWVDSHHLLDAERKQMETELNKEIIETVVARAKEKIKNDTGVQKKASNKILSTLGN